MNTAVVKFNALADSVGSAAQDNNFFRIRYPCFAFCFIGGIVIRRGCRKFCGTGVHQLVNRDNAKVFSCLLNLFFRQMGEVCQLFIREAVFFGFLKEIPGKILAGKRYLFFKIHDLFHLVEEPGVNPGHFIDRSDRHAVFNGIFYIKQPLGIGCGKFILQFIAADTAGKRIFAISPKPCPIDFKGPQSFLKGFFKGPANGHGFPHGFHGCSQNVLGFREFFKGPSGDFDHAIINGRLKTGKGFTGDIIGNFIQSIPHRQFGGNFRNGKSCGLGGQSRASGYPWVHLHNNKIPVFRIDGKLDI